MKELADIDVTVVADREIDEKERLAAEEVIRLTARTAPRPVLHARVRLRLLGNPAVARSAVASASLDVSGRLVRAHVAARDIREALALLATRLRRNLAELDDSLVARRRRSARHVPGEWHHGDAAPSRPDYFPRPPDEREVIRHKSLALARLAPMEAALELNVLDYDFHLFVNAVTGEENVVHRLEDGSVALTQITPHGAQDDGLGVDAAPAPPLSLAAAVARLNASGERFLFFAETASGRGNVLYLRYDGHYGLIEPSAA